MVHFSFHFITGCHHHNLGYHYKFHQFTDKRISKRSEKTKVRKLFHLLIILVYLPGVVLDPVLLHVASVVAMVVMVIVEVIGTVVFQIRAIHMKFSCLFSYLSVKISQFKNRVNETNNNYLILQLYYVISDHLCDVIWNSFSPWGSSVFLLLVSQSGRVFLSFWMIKMEDWSSWLQFTFSLAAPLHCGFPLVESFQGLFHSWEFCRSELEIQQPPILDRSMTDIIGKVIVIVVDHQNGFARWQKSNKTNDCAWLVNIIIVINF